MKYMGMDIGERRMKKFWILVASLSLTTNVTNKGNLKYPLFKSGNYNYNRNCNCNRS
jgi:hypothetical protein